MKARCPVNPEHETFATTAHVMEVWFVDAEGTFLESGDTLETVHGPDTGNLWHCAICAEEGKDVTAVVED